MYAHQKHVFCQPTFAVGAGNGEAKSEFLESNRIPRILVIDGENAIFFQIDIDSSLIDIFRHILFEFTRAMDEDEKVVGILRRLERLVAAAIEQIFGMRDIGGVCDLQRENRKRRVRRAEATESDVHIFARHDAVEEAHDFIDARFAVERRRFEAKINRFRDEQLRVGLVAGLVLGTVEVVGVAAHREHVFFASFEGFVAQKLCIFGRIIDDDDRLGLAQPNVFIDDGRDARVVECG